MSLSSISVPVFAVQRRSNLQNSRSTTQAANSETTTTVKARTQGYDPARTTYSVSFSINGTS